jgi:hypothetical protein
MLQNPEHLLRRKLRVEKGCAFALAESLAADPAAEQESVRFAVAITNVKVASVAFTVKLAAGIQTTES